MSASRKSREKLGRRAEFLAANYLRLKGYRILETRFKTKLGEIDLIAAKKDLLLWWRSRPGMIYRLPASPSPINPSSAYSARPTYSSGDDASISKWDYGLTGCT